MQHKKKQKLTFLKRKVLSKKSFAKHTIFEFPSSIKRRSFHVHWPLPYSCSKEKKNEKKEDKGDRQRFNLFRTVTKFQLYAIHLLTKHVMGLMSPATGNVLIF